MIPGALHQLDTGKAEIILHMVTLELISATHKNGTFHNAHEGWAVTYEELDELWEEVREKYPSQQRLLKEAMQTAAMAIRFIHDLIDDEVLEGNHEEMASVADDPTGVMLVRDSE